MKYHLIDANDKILGRLAAEAAVILHGKNKVGFKPNIDGGDAVAVINSDKIRISGDKTKSKIYHRFSGYPSGIKSTAFSDQLKKNSREIIKEAIRGMLPKNKLRKLMMRRLFVYKDEKHPHKIDINR